MIMGYRSCDGDPDLYRKVKEAVTIQQAAEYCGLKMGPKGICLCPFHTDKNPSLKLYPDGKGFYCFACGAGGDQINLVARYYQIGNWEAARRLAAAFAVPLRAPVSYREKREAALVRERRQERNAFEKRAKLFLQMYWILLCEARREVGGPHFDESLQRLDYVEYLLECLDSCVEEVWKDKKAVEWIGEIERRIADWYAGPGEDRSVSG